MTMPRLLAAALGLLFLFMSACATPDKDLEPTSPTENPAISEVETDSAGIIKPSYVGPAPDFNLPTLAGDTLRLADLRGQVVLINFWATWCGPCVEEIPEFVELYEELHPQGLAIVGITVDEEGAEIVAPFAARFNINYPVALDPEGAVAEEYGGVFALPTTYVIDAEGQIVDRVIGLYPVAEKRPALLEMLSGL